MSAQLFQHVTTRLLIAEKSEENAYELDSLLRDAGISKADADLEAGKPFWVA